MAPLRRRSRLWPNLCSVGWLAGLVISAHAAPVRPPTADMIAGGPAGPWRRLFLDAMVVEQQQGLRRVFHAARKYERNPVLRRDQPWELAESCTGPYLYGTVLWDDGKLRMWYHAYTGEGYANALAESVDGLRWTKPALGLVEYAGSKANNLFLTTSATPEEPALYQGGGKCHNAGVVKRPGEPDPAKRYALFCYSQEYRHARVAFSPDGLRWTFAPETAKTGLFGSSDVLNFGYDPYRSRYYATWKAGSRRGRAAGVVFSTDGLKWTKPVEEPVFVADDLDPDATQIYGMPVFPYQGLYVGLPWIYNARWFTTGGYTDQRMYEAEQGSPCTIDVQMAWSWDMTNWSRPPERLPFIPRGEGKAFDGGMIFTARAPVQVGDELWFYYGGFDSIHSDNAAKTAIGLAMLRLDGFCSMRAGATEGWLVSRRERMARPRVTINARVERGGTVVAELLDRKDAVIPGFSRADCDPFTGDSVRHVLTWKTAELPAALVAPDKKIRFILKHADLYSYLPDQSPLPQTLRYSPAENGGLLPDDPALPEDQRFGGGGHPSGYRLVKEDGLVYADLHSAAELKTHAAYWRDADWNDETDWGLQARLRVVDQGTEPVYGLACFMRPSSARNANLYLSNKAVGIMTTASPTDYRILAQAPLDTSEFHWYRLFHAGGEAGTVALSVDGREVLRVPYQDLAGRAEGGWNITFGPNASHGEGRMHVAAFGVRIGGTEPVFDRP